MQAGKKVYIKIRSEQLDDTVGTSSNWVYQLLSGYTTTTVNSTTIPHFYFTFFYNMDIIYIDF
jgi:hypothetical protein